MKPWLILTLWRTGGTTLTAFLSALSDLPTLEHEPLNEGRALGFITAAFHKSGDQQALAQQLARALDRQAGKGLKGRPNIKHCIETVPAPVTTALIDAALERGYGLIVLTRRDEAQRQMSLALAMATGAWGPKQAAQVYPALRDGTQQAKPIDLSALRARVNSDYAALARCLTVLRARRADYRWVLFEEMLGAQADTSLQAGEIAAYLGLDADRGTDALAAFVAGQGQGSAAISDLVPNATEARALLAQLCPT